MEEIIPENILSFRSRKTEISYHHLQQEYDSIMKKYNNNQRLTIDFDQCQIKQNTIERVMKDLFMIYEIPDDEVRGAFHHKFFNIEKLTIILTSTLFTDVSFLSYFFIYRNIQEIIIDCEYHHAIQFFKLTKDCHRVKYIKCNSFFTKQFDIYQIQSNTILLDQSIVNIEDQIDTLKLQIESQNYNQIISILEKCCNLRDIHIDITNLNDGSKDFKKLIKTLQNNMKLLKNAYFNLFLEELIPPIKKELFAQQDLKILIDYSFPLRDIELKSLLRKIHTFADYNDGIKIYETAEYKDYELKLSFLKRDQLNDEDMKELKKFISKLNNKLTNLKIEFQSDQYISVKNWVEIINHLCSFEELKNVSISGSSISSSVVALSVAKLLKCKKRQISIKGQTFINGILKLTLLQLSDYKLNVITDNIFAKFAPQISSLQIDSYQIMGELQPISKYIMKNHYVLKQMKLQIEQDDIDLHEYYYNMLLDRNNIKKYLDSFIFNQNNQLTLTINNSFIQCQLNGKQYSIENINTYLFTHYHNLNQAQAKSQSLRLKKLFNDIPFYLSNNEKDIVQYIKIFGVYSLFMKVLNLYEYIQTQPTVMLAFYTILPQYLMNNPYQVYTDLYYD